MCLEGPWRHPTNYLGSTLPETNMAPENRPLGKEIPIGNHHFWVLCLFQGGYLELFVYLQVLIERGSFLSTTVVNSTYQVIFPT